MVNQLRKAIQPILNIALIVATIAFLYTCTCRLHKTQTNGIAPVHAPSKYTDMDLVDTNKLNTHMKAKVKDPKPEPTYEEIKTKHSVTPSDYRFNICGESKVQDQRIENKNYNLPLGLMCRESYRKNISEPILTNPHAALVRGHKGCKA